MSGIWRGMMCAGVLAAVQPPLLMAAPLLTAAAEAAQPVTPPAPPAPAVPPEPPRMRYQEQTQREREAQARAREAEREAQKQTREAERMQSRSERASWVDTEPIVREFKGGDGMTLELLNMLGDVIVVGGKGRDGKLSVVRRIQGRTADADALLKAYEIDVSEHANRIAVRTTMPRSSQREWRPRVRTDYQYGLLLVHIQTEEGK